MAPGFRAFVARTTDAGTRGGVEVIGRDALPAGDVTIDVEYSSLNYKDALAATGQNKIAAGYPHVPGIDAAGTVAGVDRPGVDGRRSRAGDRLRLRRGAVRRLGALCTRAVGWVVRIPEALSTFEAMAIGTAGFTAAIALEALAAQRHEARRAARWS